MAQIKDVMTPNCQWVAPEASIAQAAQAMRDQDIGFLPVGENDRLIGMITDRDIAIRSAAAGQNPSQATVREAMTEKTYYCYDDQDVEEICNNMGEIQVRRLPVVNRDKRLVGVVSIGDLAQVATRANVGQTEQQITAANANRKAA
ncbi:MAG TPA: CBS domain-containing protein [Alphaproteobacteria bacterium]|nr:CBS domain-containing protein [Alphaproteobacteria bacterium]